MTNGRPTGATSAIAAKHVAGYDGARSSVRAAIGRHMDGDDTDQARSVMAVLVDTDFPDVRLKCALHSANHGYLLVIPREGGYLVRLYIELDTVQDADILSDPGRVTPEQLARRQPRAVPVTP